MIISNKIITGKECLYRCLVKAVYDTALTAAIIYEYEKLSVYLKDNGFIMNEYDLCTFNKMVNREQLTVKFHVDELKALHKEQIILNEFLNNVRRSEFGQEDELAETNGLVHEYLGITINYSIPGKVAFLIYDFLEKVILEESKDLKKSCEYYLGNDKLFKVDENSSKRPPKKAELFHFIVAELLFTSKRGRPDTQVCVAFSYTRDAQKS